MVHVYMNVLYIPSHPIPAVLKDRPVNDLTSAHIMKKQKVIYMTTFVSTLARNHTSVLTVQKVLHSQIDYEHTSSPILLSNHSSAHMHC